MDRKKYPFRFKISLTHNFGDITKESLQKWTGANLKDGARGASVCIKIGNGSRLQFFDMFLQIKKTSRQFWGHFLSRECERTFIFNINININYLNPLRRSNHAIFFRSPRTENKTSPGTPTLHKNKSGITTIKYNQIYEATNQPRTFHNSKYLSH